MGHEIPIHWRLREIRYKLQGEVCPHCSSAIFPPRDICPDCGENAKYPIETNGKGEVEAFTTVESQTGNKKVSIARIKLEEGFLVTAQLTDIKHDEIQVGMPVELTERKVEKVAGNGKVAYIYKFRPQEDLIPQKQAA